MPPTSLKASESNRKQMEYITRGFKEMVGGIRIQYESHLNMDNRVQKAGEEIMSYKLRIINQLSFVEDTKVELTRTHYNRLVCLASELCVALEAYHNSTPSNDTINGLRDLLEDWSYKYDRYWFLFAIYLDDPTTLIQRLPDHISTGLPKTRYGTPKCDAINNSTLQYVGIQPTGTSEVFDGHGLVVEYEDPSLSNDFPERSSLSHRLRNAAALSSSLMNTVAVLSLNKKTPTPLVFETKMELESCETLRTTLWDGTFLVEPEQNAQVAHGLAEAVHGLHICNVQHGSIMPECVLVVSKTEVLLHGFLCDPSKDWGWKTIGGTCSFQGYYDVARRGQRTMKHDIRNLGICLLELGSVNSLLKKEEGLSQPGELDTVKGSNYGSSKVSKKDLLELVDNHLGDVGHRFSEVVRLCLTVDELRLGDKTVEEKVELAIWFIDKVLLELRKVNVHYEGVPP